MTSVREFRIAVPDHALKELSRKIVETRWPDAIENSSWNYGTDLHYLKELAVYWARAFDWRKQEARLNQLPQFRVTIDGCAVHFVHQRGEGPAPLPIVLTHGWPSTFVEMERLIPLLANPSAHGGDASDAFDVVVPSLPGFGFSDRSRVPGMTPLLVATLWSKLMTEELGYTRYAAHGGDIGSSVTARVGFIDPSHVVGIHLTYVSGSALIGYLGPGSAPLTSEESRFQRESEQWAEAEGAYSHLQRTKPQTLAYALNDSPVGLASWIVEKFRGWSDCRGDVELRFTKDELLTHISIYWFTETIASSMRMYFETRSAPWRFGPADRIKIPTGVTLFPEDIPVPPRPWAERIFNITHWGVMPRGGHFAAHEEPELLAQEIRSFFRPLR
jgi:pimeloyl-ACP methyl ester carboxylesterase